jgi:serine/threonine protein kinase
LEFPDYLSAEVKDFVSKLLVKEPMKRLPLEEVLKHPWITKYYEKK